MSWDIIYYLYFSVTVSSIGSFELDGCHYLPLQEFYLNFI
jgi:hypothetical protein